MALSRIRASRLDWYLKRAVRYFLTFFVYIDGEFMLFCPPMANYMMIDHSSKAVIQGRPIIPMSHL